MPLKNGSYYGKTAAPQYQTYPTAGLMKPTPLPSVAPVPKPTNEGGFAGTSPVNPAGPTPPPVGTTVSQDPALNAVLQPAMQPPVQQATPRDQLVRAIMGGGKGFVEV